MTNKNGFEDSLKQMKTLLNVNTKVADESLKEAADYFTAQLKKNIPKSKLNKGNHLQDQLEVKAIDGGYSVTFGESAWYWHLVNNGHKKRGGGRIKGAHFVQGTLTAEDKKLTEIMTGKIMKAIGGN